MKPPALLALSPGDLSGDPRGASAFLDQWRAAHAGGLRGLLLREPELGDRAYLELALQVRAACGGTGEEANAGVWLALHDRPHLAASAGADGVHLGFRSLPPERVPASCVGDRALGLSTHAGDAVAANTPLTYVFHGPLHATPSKEGLLEPLGEAALARFTAGCPRPVWAIGGLTPERVAGALGAGASGVAVRAAILGARNPESAAREFTAALEACA